MQIFEIHYSHNGTSYYANVRSESEEKAVKRFEYLTGSAIVQILHVEPKAVCDASEVLS